MKFSCDGCAAKYKVPDEKVSGRTLKMACRKCGETIIIRGDKIDGDDTGLLNKPSPQPKAPSAPPRVSKLDRLSRAESAPPGLLPKSEPPRPSAVWHVSINDVPVGPISLEELSHKMEAAAISEYSLVWRETFDEWRPLATVPELISLLQKQRASVSPTAAKRSSLPAIAEHSRSPSFVPAMAPINTQPSAVPSPMFPQPGSVPPPAYMSQPVVQAPGSYTPPPGSFAATWEYARGFVARVCICARGVAFGVVPWLHPTSRLQPFARLFFVTSGSVTLWLVSRIRPTTRFRFVSWFCRSVPYRLDAGCSDAEFARHGAPTAINRLYRKTFLSGGRRGASIDARCGSGGHLFTKSSTDARIAVAEAQRIQKDNDRLTLENERLMGELNGPQMVFDEPDLDPEPVVEPEPVVDPEPEPEVVKKTVPKKEVRKTKRTPRVKKTTEPTQEPAKDELSADEKKLLAQFSEKGGVSTKSIKVADTSGPSTTKKNSLDVSDLNKVRKRGEKGLQRCYERASRGQSGGSAVRMTVNVVVAPSGRVNSTKVTGNGPGGLSQCMEASVKRWRFPTASESTETKFAIVFSS